MPAVKQIRNRLLLVGHGLALYIELECRKGSHVTDVFAYSPAQPMLAAVRGSGKSICFTPMAPSC